MGLIQNKVKVSQPNSHVVVKNAGGLRGLTGETGQPGPQGVPGQAATVTAGTTTTLPAGSNATVQNVGSTSAAIFNFGIPQGEKGDTGESGAAATISVGTTTTLEPGEDATVTNSGTSSAAVFNFGIPKGVKGDTGSQGVPGVDGFSPTATVSKTGDTATITITDKNGTTTAQISDGVTPTIDPELSPTSENPVQNKVVTNALAGKADKPIVVSSLPTTGTAGQEYFVDDRYNTVTELKGDTEQTTYSGKNLFQVRKTTQTQNNVTFTYNGDGTFNISASTPASAGTEFAIVVPLSESGIVSGQKYTLSSDKPVGTASDSMSYWVHSCDSGGTWVKSLMGFTSAGTQTAQEPTTQYVKFVVNVRAGFSSSYTNVKTQLELGSTPTSFEPYVGGTASPNPDYPQEVQTVTGEQTVTVAGKNLCNGVNQNYYLTSTGEAGGQASGNSGLIIPVELNTNYTISTPITQTRYRIGFVDTPYQGSALTAYNGAGMDGTSNTITRNSNTHGYLIVNATDLTKVQVEKGSTSTPYEPYQGGSYPVNLGKNLYEGSPSFDAFSGISAWEDGGTYNNMPVIKRAAAWSGAYRLINIEAGVTYTFSAWVKSDEARQVAIYAIGSGATATISPNNKTITTSTSWERVSFTFTCLTSGTIALRFENTSASTTNYTYISGYQLELGSSATTYAPYFTPIELCKIGIYQDYIYKSGEDWYVKKNIGKSAMGSLTWNPASTGTSGVYRMYSDGIRSSVVIPATGSEIAKIICSHYTPETAANTWSTMVGVAVQTTDGRLFVYDSNYNTNTSQSAFTTWLTNNSVAVYYALATPTDTQITNSALIAQLEALAGAKIMVDGGTATVTSQYLPATLTTAYNSNSGYIDYIYDGTNFVKVR